MTSKRADQQLSGLISAANAITDETLSDFGKLTAHQLNWKPSTDQWSVAQCFDHLVTANQTYFPLFDEVLSGEKKNTVWQGLPWLPAFWGKMVIKTVAPQTTRKRKAPTIFRPSSSNIDDDIIRRFVDQQNQIIRYMQGTEDLDLEKIKISSPVSRLIAYSLMDAYTIIITHEKRHVLQARRVTEMNGFPERVSQGS
jgi:hypothetical protein